MAENNDNDGLALELSVTEQQVIKQLVRLEARMNKAANKMEENWNKSSRKAMSRVDKMNRSIGASVDRAMARVGNGLKGAAAGLVGGVLAGGMVEIAARARDVVRGIAEVGDQARRSGVDAEAFQEWKYVAEQNRIGIDQMIDGLKEMNLRADEFVTTGKGSAAEAFTRLGYSGSQLGAALKDPSKLLLEIIDRLGEFDQAARIRIADEVFGGSAGERFVELIDQGEAGLRRTIQRAHEVGAVMDAEMIRKADELDRRFNDVAVSVANVGKKAIVGWAMMIDDLRDALDGLDDVRTKAIIGDEVDPDNLGGAKRGVQELTALSDVLITNVRTLSQELSDVSAEVGELGNDQLSYDLGRAADNMMALVVQLENGMIDMEKFNEGLLLVLTRATNATDELKKIDEVGFTTVITGIINVGGALQTIIEKMRSLKKEASSASAPEKVYSGRGSDPRATPGLAPTSSPRPRAAPPMLGESGSGSSGGGGGSSGRSLIDDMRRLQERTAALNAEAAALAMVAAAGGKYATSIDYARKKAELLMAAQREGKSVTPELEAQIDGLAMAYAEAANAADMARDRLDMMRDNARAGADAMTDLFMGIMSGSDGAKGALANLLEQIAQVQVQKAMLSASGSGGFFGWIGGLLSPASSSSLPVGKMPSAISNPGFATSKIAEASRSSLPSASADGMSGALDIAIGFDETAGHFVASVRDQTGREIGRAIAENNREAVPAIVRKSLKHPRMR